MKFILQQAHPNLLLMIAGSILLLGCQQTGSINQHDQQSRWVGFVPLAPMEEGPTYHLLEGYDPIWLEYVKQGVERSRAYWGSYGPTHVWVLGREDGSKINAQAKKTFIKEYCDWRTAGSHRTITECYPHAERQFFDVIQRGEPEAYLSEVRDTNPHMAELIFINVHQWYFPDDSIPDPVLRGIHEYTHVFQQSIGEIPTWMAEGGAVFIEAWLPRLDGQRDPKLVMRWIMERAHKIENPKLTIADMEEIETATKEAAEYYMELAYDSGAWATVFMIHKSAQRSVASLRDEFYPLVAEIGWEAALCRYVGMKNKTEFYEAFEVFMDLPIAEQLQHLDELNP